MNENDELHPLDKLCTRCRLRIHDSASGRSYTHPVLLDSLEEVCGVILGMYASNRKETVMTIELSDDPTVLPTQLYLRFKEGMFPDVEHASEYAQQDPARARATLENAIRAIAVTMRSLYDGVFGSDRVRKVQPSLAWEDLL